MPVRAGRVIALWLVLLAGLPGAGDGPAGQADGPAALGAQTMALPAALPGKDPQARAAYLAGDFPLAGRLLARRLAADPADHEAAFLLGLLEGHCGNHAQAVQYLARALAQVPDRPEYLFRHARAFGENLSTLNPFEAFGQAGAFREVLEKAIRLAPREPELRMMLALFHLQAPGLVGGDRRLGREQLAALRQLDPVFAWRLEAWYEAAEGRPDRAEAAFRAGTATGYARAWDDWSDWLCSRGRADEALALLLEHRDSADQPLAMDYSLARLAFRQGRQLAQAQAALERYLAAPWEPDLPTKTQALCLKAGLLLAQGRRDEARQALQAGLALLPGHREARAALERLR